MRSVRTVPLSLALGAMAAVCAGCATGPGFDAVEDWEVVVQAPEGAVGTVAGGTLDRTFQVDLIDELQSARGILARTPEADELIDGTRGQTLYLDADVRPGASGRVVVFLRQSVGGPAVWENEYLVQSGSALDDFTGGLINDIARDVAAVVREIRRS